ncbi:MAG: hypothetical protein Q3972_05260 [Corynebacterium sp.]|nr:hypothetical protein [Corynebacterium sp.]
MSRFFNWRVAWAGVLLIVIIGGFAFMMQAKYTVPTAHINGDTLGRDNSETLSAYQERAEASLAAAPEGENLWALVTFREVVDTQTAGAAAEAAGIPRVGSIVLDVGTPIAVPEPTGSDNRAAVFDRTIAHYTASGVRISGIAGLVVYAPKSALVALASNPQVMTVEPAEPDASRARMGIQRVI